MHETPSTLFEDHRERQASAIRERLGTGLPRFAASDNSMNGTELDITPVADEHLQSVTDGKPPWRNGRRFGLKTRSRSPYTLISLQQLEQFAPSELSAIRSEEEARVEKRRADDRARKAIYRANNKGKLKAYAADYYLKNPEKMKENAVGWQKANKQAVSAIQKAAAARHPEKCAARIAVSTAIASGRLVKQPCEVCGAKKVHGHHEDYSKQLEVNWLCCKHHAIADRKRRERLATASLPSLTGGHHR